jgi:DNA helicase-2/ATP-dependent DNA helicase PcrA
VSTKGLNLKQKEATESVVGPTLILAGAGSGKTRVLTHRIAHLIHQGYAMPGEILSLTFTNKAAAEMRERVHKLLGTPDIPVHDIWLATFHSMGARLLRDNAHLVGRESNFSIFDSSDQLAAVKKAMEACEVSDKILSPKSILYKIEGLKNDGINPSDYSPVSGSFFENKATPVIRKYQEILKENNAVDFGDLLLLTYELFKNHETFTDDFQDRYRFVLVDEYQDTNPVQYKLLRLITQKYRNLCVVGDEDQSIYRWRGADIRNILDFEKDFPEAKVVKLEENYRSTKHIIEAASKVISNNFQRKEKTLFTHNPDGELIEVHMVDSDWDEAQWVVSSITQKLRDGGYSANEVAIFYRTHAQSRLLEDRLRYARHNYKIFGGLKFYDRAEVKDIIAYFRVLINPKDDLSLMRIINVPTRGIGKTSLTALQDFAVKEKCSCLEAIGILSSDPSVGDINNGTRRKLSAFLELFAQLQKACMDMSAKDFYLHLLDKTGYLNELKRENSVEAQARIDNLEELASALDEFDSRAADSSLRQFLEEVALLTDLDKEKNQDSPFITLMTLHSAKGLEYPLVYLVGLEDGIFPSIREQNQDDPDDIEEERRLCYVGMTRAMKKLHLSSAQNRKIFGRTHIQRPSRFLEEIPSEHKMVYDHRSQQNKSFRASNYDSFDNDDFSFSYSQSNPKADAFLGVDTSEDTQKDGFPVGKRVKHPDYGTGTVVSRSGGAQDLKVSVRFDRFGLKKFIARFAPLEAL